MTDRQPEEIIDPDLLLLDKQLQPDKVVEEPYHSQDSNNSSQQQARIQVVASNHSKEKVSESGETEIRVCLSAYFQQ